MDMGMDGADGVDGVDGVDGAAGSCVGSAMGELLTAGNDGAYTSAPGDADRKANLNPPACAIILPSHTVVKCQQVYSETMTALLPPL
jgi:hypothetical protein